MTKRRRQYHRTIQTDQNIFICLIYLYHLAPSHHVAFYPFTHRVLRAYAVKRCRP